MYIIQKYEEQLQDIIQICDYLLNDILHNYSQADGGVEGEVIGQLRWIQQQAKNHSLELPIDPNFVATLRRVHLDGELNHCTSSPYNAYLEVEIYLARLLAIILDAKLLYKEAYSKITVQLIHILNQTTEIRTYSNYRELMNEMHIIEEFLDLNPQNIPLKSIMPQFPFFRDIYTKSVIENEIHLVRVRNLISVLRGIVFGGVRPDAWISLGDADTYVAQMKRELV